jgi:hypothetical protein
MRCSICDLPLKPEWKFCPDCGYNAPGWDEHMLPLFDDGEASGSFTLTVGGQQHQPQIQGNIESFAPPVAPYGNGVRAQVFEVIVRQALAGAPWREICEGPMFVNKITHEEVEAEVRRRRGDDGPSSSGGPGAPLAPPMPAKIEAAKVVMPAERLAGVRSALEKMLADKDLQPDMVVTKLREVLAALDSAISTIESQQAVLDEIEREAQLQRDLDREIRRGMRPLGSNDDHGRHYFT